MSEWKEVVSAFWKPVSVEESVIGLHCGNETTQFGPAVLLKLADDSKLLLGQTVAVSKLRGLDGRVVRVMYAGEIKPAKGKPYKDFKVFVVSAEPAEVV